MGLCNVSGIGGGAIDVILIMIFFSFPTKHAVAVSNLVILLGAILRFFYNFNDKNPNKPNVVLLDYSIVTTMMATTLAGS